MLKHSVTIVVSQTCPLWPAEFHTIARKVACTTLQFLHSVTSAYELGLILSDNASLQTLNQRYRGYNKPTNVLSFSLHNPYHPPPHPFLLGDVYLAYETIQQECEQMHLSLSAHFSHLIVHGILHLFSYEHGQSMQRQETTILEFLNYKEVL